MGDSSDVVMTEAAPKQAKKGGGGKQKGVAPAAATEAPAKKGELLKERNIFFCG